MNAPNALSDAAVAGLRAIAHDLGAPMLVQRIAEPGATPDGDFVAAYRDGDAWPYASATDPRVVAFLEAWTPETAAALADEVLRLRADAALSAADALDVLHLLDRDEPEGNLTGQARFARVVELTAKLQRLAGVEPVTYEEACYIVDTRDDD